MRAASYARLPCIAFSSMFEHSLIFRFRIRRGTNDARSAVRTRHFAPVNSMDERDLSLGSVLVMLFLSTEFDCAVIPSRRPGTLQFEITCRLCGDGSSISVMCPVSGCVIRASTRHPCCEHFFLGGFHAARRSDATVFVTNPQIGGRTYSAEHSIRKTARTLLAGHSLRPADTVLLRSRMTTTRFIRDGIVEHVHISDSLCFVLEQFPRDFDVRHGGEQEFALTGNGEPIRSLRRVAPWALAALRRADFDELDASFKAIRPYVY